MISTIFWKNLLALQWMSTFFVELKKVFQEQEQQQQEEQKKAIAKTASAKPRGQKLTQIHWMKQITYVSVMRMIA